jgi:hypothetical protein
LLRLTHLSLVVQHVLFAMAEVCEAPALIDSAHEVIAAQNAVAAHGD